MERHTIEIGGHVFALGAFHEVTTLAGTTERWQFVGIERDPKTGAFWTIWQATYGRVTVQLSNIVIADEEGRPAPELNPEPGDVIACVLAGDDEVTDEGVRTADQILVALRASGFVITKHDHVAAVEANWRKLTGQA